MWWIKIVGISHSSFFISQPFQTFYNTENRQEKQTMAQNRRPNPEYRRAPARRGRAIVDEEFEELIREMISILLLEMVVFIILFMIIWICNSPKVLKAVARLRDKFKPLVSIVIGGEFYRVSNFKKYVLSPFRLILVYLQVTTNVIPHFTDLRFTNFQHYIILSAIL